MIKIEFPKHPFRIKEEEGKEFIFDAIRKCWLCLTPEEWVRQNFIQYLIQVLQYPASLIAIEKEIMLGELVKRFDILVYDKQHTPWMMVECKGMDIPLNEKALEQIVRYTISVPVPYIIITNGSYTCVYEKDTTGISLIQRSSFPPY